MGGVGYNVNDGQQPSLFQVLNEVVVDRGPSSYLSNVDLFLDGHLITTVQGDGECSCCYSPSYIHVSKGRPLAQAHIGSENALSNLTWLLTTKQEQNQWYKVVSHALWFHGCVPSMQPKCMLVYHLMQQ